MAGTLEIACDESGSEGEKLIGATTDVFAHAGVQLCAEAAAACVAEIRRRAPTPAVEFKANHILREKNRSALAWFLGTAGPLHGNAHVYLADKAYLVVGKVIDLLVHGASSARVGLHQDEQARAMTVSLYREGRGSFDRELWQAFLLSSNNLMRARNRRGVRTSVDTFFHVVDDLRAAAAGAADEVLGLLVEARTHADSLREQLLDTTPAMIPALDPLIPAIVRAVVAWSEGDRPVSIVHDRQIALSVGRIAQIEGMFRDPDPALLGYVPLGRLAGLRLVDSRTDARVQVADILAGAARKIASDELNDRADPELTALLRPFVDPFSVWGDERGWSVLGSARTGRPS